MESLFKLTEQQNHVLQMIENEDLTLEEAQDTLEALGMEINDKIEAYCHVNRKLSAELEALKNEEARIKQLKTEKDSQIKRLKSHLLTAMQNADMTKCDTGLFKVSTRKGVQSINVINESRIPAEFAPTTIITKVDKIALKKYLQGGGECEGAELVTGNPSLTIK